MEGLEFKIDPNDSEKFIKDTTLKNLTQQVELSLEYGTIKITKELAEQAVFAIQSRIDSTADYTKKRIERINKNYELYESTKADKTNAVIRENYGSIFNSVEDWVDDLVSIFSKLPDSIRLTGKGKAIDKYIAKRLEKDERDEDPILGGIRSLATQVFNEDNVKENDVYYFKVKEAIKEMMRESLKESGYDQCLEDFIYNGVISGMFIVKEGWGNKEKVALEIHEDTDDKKHLTNGKFLFKAEQENSCQFIPKDPRRLIFRKDKIDWMIEMFDCRFSELLNKTFDGNKVKEYPVYDPDMLARIKEYLGQDNKEMRNADDEYNKMLFGDVDSDFNSIWKYDGDVCGYEAHHIPLVINNKVVVCMIVCLKIDEKLIPIRIQKTSFLELPYKYSWFGFKKNDMAGRGLPEIIEGLQGILTDFFDYSVDMMNMSLRGVFVGNIENLMDPNALSNIKPGELIKLKNLRGAPIESALKWFTPPLEALSYMERMFGLVTQLLERTTRKGPGGEKIQPNPSATEYSRMVSELEKSVNRCGIRLNDMMQQIVKNQYMYQMLNRDSYFNIKMKSINIVSGDSLKQVDKDIILHKKELFVKGIDFEVDCLELGNDQQAVEKQQQMQLIDVLYNKIGVIEQQQQPDGTVKNMPKVYKDDTGSEVVLDEYKLVRKVLTMFGHDDLFISPKTEKQSINNQPMMNNQPINPPVDPRSFTPGIQAPDLSNSNPSTGNILSGVNNVR